MNNQLEQKFSFPNGTTLFLWHAGEVDQRWFVYWDENAGMDDEGRNIYKRVSYPTNLLPQAFEDFSLNMMKEERGNLIIDEEKVMSTINCSKEDFIIYYR